MATFKVGEANALDFLAEILPDIGVGVQAGVFDDLSEAWTPENAETGAAFLARTFDLVAGSESNEPRRAFAKAITSLQEVSSTHAVALRDALQAKAGGSLDLRIRTLLARIVGIVEPSPNAVEEALHDLLGTDHLKRLSASELLHEAAGTTDRVSERLLALPADQDMSMEVINAIYWVASGSRCPEHMLAVLDRWAPTEHGAGSAYRVLMENAAKAGPERALAWLKAHIPVARTAARKRQVLVGFQILAENAVGSISAEDVRHFFQWGFASPGATDEMKRVFANTAGRIAEIDVSLAQEIFQRIFRTRRRDFINAAINSLRSVTKVEILVSVFDLTRTFAMREHRSSTMGHFLEVLSHHDLEVRKALVRRFAVSESRSFLKTLDDPVVVSRILALLKSTARADLPTVLELSELCPVPDNANAAALSAVLENATLYTADHALLRSILQRLMALASIPQNRVHNSLLRALPRLDRLLPHREVVEAVKTTILSEKHWKEAALSNLARAAKRMESWTSKDTEALIRGNLPARAKAVLLS